VDDLPARVRLDLEHFFRAAVVFEHKHLTLRGWTGPAAALTLVRSAARRTAKRR